MSEALRDFLDVMGDEHYRGAAGVLGQAPSRDSSRSRPPMSRPAQGSSSSNSCGSLMRARASMTCCRSPSDSTPKGRSAIWSKPADANNRSAFSHSAWAIGVPPRFEGAPAGRDHYLPGCQTGDDHARDAGRNGGDLFA